MKKKIIPSVIIATFLSGCATNDINQFKDTVVASQKKVSNSLKETFASDDPCSNNARNIGVVAGGVAGLIIGNQIGNSTESKVISAGIGATLGGLIGADIDRRRCELSKIAKENNLEITFEELKPQSGYDQIQEENKNGETFGLKVAITEKENQFKSNSDILTKDSKKYFEDIAKQYSYTEQKKKLPKNPSKEDLQIVEDLKEKKILLVGHTDDNGISEKNAELSEKRAKAVAKIFKEKGVPEENLYFQGAGETMPIADNKTEEGRLKNRRVEIIDVTNNKSLNNVLQNRKPKVSFYRSVENDKLKSVVVSKNTVVKSNDNVIKDNNEIIEKIKPSKISQNIDFGGVPIDNKNSSVVIGKSIEKKSTFSLISNAYADEPFSASCLQDRPRIANGVKSLKSEKEYSTGEFLPGLYGTSWTDKLNGHLVAITNVNVLRDDGVPASKPKLLIYENYQSSKQKPNFTYSPDVNVYRGEKGVLYRIFAKDQISCIDMVIPYKSNQAVDSKLYYNINSYFVSNFQPTIVK